MIFLFLPIPVLRFRGFDGDISDPDESPIPALGRGEKVDKRLFVQLALLNGAFLSGRVLLYIILPIHAANLRF